MSTRENAFAGIAVGGFENGTINLRGAPHDIGIRVHGESPLRIDVDLGGVIVQCEMILKECGRILKVVDDTLSVLESHDDGEIDSLAAGIESPEDDKHPSAQLKIPLHDAEKLCRRGAFAVNAGRHKHDGSIGKSTDREVDLPVVEVASCDAELKLRDAEIATLKEELAAAKNKNKYVSQKKELVTRYLSMQGKYVSQKKDLAASKEENESRDGELTTTKKKHELPEAELVIAKETFESRDAQLAVAKEMIESHLTIAKNAIEMSVAKMKLRSHDMRAETALGARADADCRGPLLGIIDRREVALHDAELTTDKDEPIISAMDLDDCVFIDNSECVHEVPEEAKSQTLLREECMCCRKKGFISKCHVCHSCNGRHIHLKGRPMRTRVRSWGRNIMRRRCANPVCDGEGVYKIRLCNPCMQEVAMTPPVKPGKIHHKPAIMRKSKDAM